MRLFSVLFDDSNVVVVKPGLELSSHDDVLCVDLGTDVGGATLAMVPFRIELENGLGVDQAGVAEGPQRILEADVMIDESGRISFRPESRLDDRAFVVLSVIQRSPDARTEIEPYTDGVECVGNAFDRPMDTQVLLVSPGASTRFRRFQRGGNCGPWHVIGWDGAELKTSSIGEDPE